MKSLQKFTLLLTISFGFLFTACVEDVEEKLEDVVTFNEDFTYDETFYIALDESASVVSRDTSDVDVSLDGMKVTDVTFNKIELSISNYQGESITLNNFELTLEGSDVVLQSPIRQDLSQLNGQTIELEYTDDFEALEAYLLENPQTKLLTAIDLSGGPVSFTLDLAIDMNIEATPL